MVSAEAAGRGGDVGDGGKEGSQREPEREGLKPTQSVEAWGEGWPGNPSTDVSASGMFVVSKL